jgi:hypothetical protein
MPDRAMVYTFHRELQLAQERLAESELPVKVDKLPVRIPDETIYITVEAPTYQQNNLSKVSNYRRVTESYTKGTNIKLYC